MRCPDVCQFVILKYARKKLNSYAFNFVIYFSVCHVKQICAATWWPSIKHVRSGILILDPPSPLYVYLFIYFSICIYFYLLCLESEFFIFSLTYGS